jgi:hypothetical protein
MSAFDEENNARSLGGAAKQNLNAAITGIFGKILTKTASGKDAGLVESLPTQQDAIVQSDSTVVDLMGLRCHTAGDVAIKLTNDTVAVVWTVTAGEIIYGRIKAVMLTDTTLTNVQMTGLK